MENSQIHDLWPPVFVVECEKVGACTLCLYVLGWLRSTSTPASLVSLSCSDWFSEFKREVVLKG